jgi:hypothetical protein
MPRSANDKAVADQATAATAANEKAVEALADGKIVDETNVGV